MTDQQNALVKAASGGVVEYNLDAFPEDKFNRLIPTQTLRLPTDLLAPVVQVVKLDPPDGQGKSADSYTSRDIPAGHRAPTARALSKFATAAGVSFFDERRVDDGSDPEVMGVSVMAEMLLPTGQRVRAPGSQVIDLRTWFGKSASEAEIAKFRKQFYGHVATRARNRAIRALLSLRQSYPDAEIAKPFAVVSFTPNMQHPEVRARILDAMAPALAGTFGPDRSGDRPRQLAAGAIIDVPEVARDEPLEGQYIEQHDDDPGWFAGAPAESPAQRLERVLREKATASQAGGPATDTQRERLQQILKPLGFDTTLAVLRRVFGLANLRDISEAQAGAVIDCAVDETFADMWRELAEDARKAAAA